MATQYIKFKRSAVPGKRPSNSQIELGELALNTNDGKLFTKKEAVGIGTTVTLLNVWTENVDGSTYYNDGNIGIGTTNPTSRLQVDGNTRINGNLNVSIGGTFPIISTLIGNASGYNVSGIAVTQTRYGIGIGTDNPFIPFYSDSDVQITNTFTFYNTEWIAANSYNNSVTRIGADSGRSIEIGMGNTDLPKYIDFGGGNFPQLLYPDHQARIIRNGTDNGSLQIINRGFGDVSISAGQTSGELGNFDVFTAGTRRLRVNSTGNVGINILNPTSRLHVVGDALVTGIVTATTFNGNLNSSGVNTANIISGTNLNYSGIGTIATLTSTNATLININSSGISTLGITSTTNLRAQQLNVSGVSTLGIVTSGNIFSTGVVTATSFVGNLTGTSSSATQLQNARTFQITGDIIASPISFDGTGNVSLAATIQPNSVGLGTDTTGDYVQSISGTSNQITVTNGAGESSTPVLSIPSQFTAPQDVTVTRDLQVNRNLNVIGNITIGGTSATLFTTEIKVSDPDLVLGFRTDALGNDISTDNTANHGGIAIASTEGNPLVQLFIAGIETTPATYKKIMWFKSGAFSGLGTDAWLINYAVGIGSTQFPTGTRLAVGSVQFTERDLSVIRNINSSGIVTATNFNGNLTGNVTGNLNSSGINTATTISGTTATYTTGNFTNLNATSGNIVTGVVTNLSGTNLNYTGVGTIVTLNSTTGTITNSSGTNLNYSGIGTITNLRSTTINNSGVTTTAILNVGTGGTIVTTTASGFVGIGTTNPINNLQVFGGITAGNATSSTLQSGYSILRPNDSIPRTFAIVEDDTNLRIGGGAWNSVNIRTAPSNEVRVAITSSGNVGIGTTNPQSTLAVGGTITELYAGQYWNVVTQADVGYGASQVPLNQYLGQLAFLDDFSPNGLRRDGGGEDDVTINSSGFVGIGTTNPTQQVQVGGIGTNTGLVISGLGSIGIATNTPTTYIDIPLNTPTTNTVQFGSFGIQSFDNVNGFLSNNGYWNGSEWIYRRNGHSSLLQFLNGNIWLRTLPVGTAGSSGNIDTRIAVQNNGNIGINTDNPLLRLQIGDFNSPNIVGITSTGFVGIATTNPTSRLTVQGDALVTGIVTATTFNGNLTGNITGNLNSSGINTISVNSSFDALRITQTGSGNALLVEDNTNPDSSPFVIKGGGFGWVGIGTTNPREELHIQSVDPVIRFVEDGASTNNRNWNFGADSETLYWQALTDDGSGGGSNFRMTRNGSEIQTFEGRNSAVTWFSVNNITRGVGIRTTNPLSSLALQVGSASTQSVVVSGIGSVGIGTTNPTARFDLIGVARMGGNDGLDVYTITYADPSSADVISIEAINRPNTVKKNLALNAYGGNVLIGSATLTGTTSQPLQVTGGAYVSGNLGIGTTNPASRLSVVGNVNIAGIVTASQFSTGSSGIGINTNTISGPAQIIIDPAAVGDNTGSVRILGDLFVDGTQTIINSTTIELADFNVGIATTVGTNALLDGAGIGIGSTNIRKTITWNNSASALTSSEDWNLVSGKQYEINGIPVLSSTTLGSGVVNSSLTSVGTLGQLNVSGVSTFTGNVSFGSSAFFGDNDRLHFGDGSDLQIYHDGGNSIINDFGTGDLFIGGSNAIRITTNGFGETNAIFTTNGSVELYYDNVKEFETTGYGATVFGTLQTQGLISSGISTISVTSSSDALRINQTGSGNALLVEDSANPDSTPFVINADGAVGIGTSIVTGGASLDVRGNPWFSPNTTGAKATALRLGRFVDGVNAAYDIITDDATGDDIEIRSNRFTGALKFSRGSDVGFQTTFVLSSHYQSGTSISIADTTGTVTKIRLDEASNSFFNNSGAVLIGSLSSTNTANQKLQVTGGAFISGNVGLGTTNPTSALSIIGDTLVTGVSTASRVILDAANNTATDGGQIFLNGATGNRIDFNTNGSAAPAFTTRSAGTKIVLYPQVGASAVDFGFGIESNAVLWSSIPQANSVYAHRWYGGTTQLADLKGSGELVLGTTSLTGTSNQRLQVTGGAYVSTRLGIGQTNPNTALHIGPYNGNTLPHIYLASGNNIFGWRLDTQDFGAGSVPLRIFRRVSGTDTEAITVLNQNGNIGIGTTIPTSTLTVQGNVLVSGIITSTDYNSASDINLKENIQPISNPIDKVLQLNGVTFDWKEDGRSSMGVIAQEVEKVIPELVNGNDSKTVNYNGLIGLLIEVVKEQQKEINNLKEKLK